MNENTIEVSVLCLAYNHEKYIRQTLDGFVMQKTNFRFEIIVHDDASTDTTADIIREYAQRYPALIRSVLQSVNQHSQKISIWKNHVNHLIKGRYVALCEGDDFWTDPLKLQKQFDAMEANPECSMCVHRIRQVAEDGTDTGTFRPSWDMEACRLDVPGFLKIQPRYPFHTSSYFVRTPLWVDLYGNPPAFRKAADVGDEPLLLYMAAHGNICYLPDCMSAYRMFSIGSWTSKNKRIYKNILRHAEKTYEMMCLYDEYTGYQYDCNLPLFRGKVLWLREEYRELIRPENKQYLAQCKLSKKAFIYLCAAFPFLSAIRKERKIQK